MNTVDPKQLQDRIDQLELQLHQVLARVAELDHPQFRIFPAKQATAKQFQEQYLNGTTFGDFTDGRKCTNDAHPNAVVPLSVGVVTLMEIRDGDQLRYIPVGGSGGVRYAKVKSGTTTGGYYIGQALTLTPCISTTDPTATGEADVVVSLVQPAYTSRFKLNDNDVIAYVTGPDGVNIALSVRQLPLCIEPTFNIGAADVFFDGTCETVSYGSVSLNLDVEDCDALLTPATTADAWCGDECPSA